MASSAAQTIPALHRLSQGCRDSEDRFRRAAAEAVSSEYQSLFSAYALQRAQFCQELEGELLRLGGSPSENPTEPLHRSWTALKTRLAAGECEELLDHCAAGEGELLSEYERVLTGGGLPVETRELAVRHASDIMATRDRLRSIRDAEEDVVQ